MFIAHMPAGFLLSKYVNEKIISDSKLVKATMIAGLIGSVLPDLDMLYFYLIDNRQHKHHSYWTHIPIFWCLIYSCTASILKFINARKTLIVFSVMTLTVFLHLLLDSIAGGGILWGYPLSNDYYHLFEVTPRFNWWVLNFIVHWTFGIEIIILLIAMLVFVRSRERSIFSYPLGES